jgi:FKBP-type peptidyl-prolyl cis-trans isomerase FklB
MGIADKLFQLKSEKAAANLKAGEAFLAGNKEKAGIITLPSGLQYEILTEGVGSKPLAHQTVTCHYHGTLIDGTVFDSSVQRGTPASFPLNMVIKGWTEGLQLMSVGSKWRFFIPPHLAYGDRQVSAAIGPNSTLIFEVELLGIS